MARLGVGDPVREGFKELAEIPSEDLARLAHAFRELPVPATRDQVLGAAHAALPARDPDALDRMFYAIMTIYSAPGYLNKTEEAFIADLVESLYKHEDFNNAPLTQQELTSRLQVLLRIDSFELASRSAYLQLDNEHNFVTARVLTDVRPIFAGENLLTPRGAVIVHLLKIDYQDQDAERTMFLALDSQDVDHLINALSRAKAKVAALAPILVQANLPYYKGEGS